MSTDDGRHFFECVNLYFAPVFERFAFEDVESTDNYNYSERVVKNRVVALRIEFEKRDSSVLLRISRLVGSKIPPIMIFAPRTVAAVTEIQLGQVLLADGWERSKALGFGVLETYYPELLDKAVHETAQALEEHAADIMRGDLEAWNRAAERAVYRDVPPSN
jgi:hypothetical protein